VLGLNSEATFIISEYNSTLPKRRHIKGFKIITRSDVDSVVSGIPPAESGGWPSSIRLVSKIINLMKMGSVKKWDCMHNIQTTEPQAVEKLL